MKETVAEILKLPRQLQAKEIEKHSKDANFLKEFAAVLVPLAEEKEYKPGALKQYSKLPVSMLNTNIIQLLKQFPEVPDNKTSFR